MEITLSSKGQIVLPVAARRELDLAQGERLDVELRDGGVFLRPSRRQSAHRLERHPVSGLPRMVPLTRPKHKVTVEEIARLHAELL